MLFIKMLIIIFLLSQGVMIIQYIRCRGAVAQSATVTGSIPTHRNEIFNILLQVTNQEKNRGVEFRHSIHNTSGGNWGICLIGNGIS